VILAVVVFFYKEPIALLISAVIHRQGSSHGLFVPLISLYLLWIKFDRVKNLHFNSALLPGGAMLSIALVLYSLGNAEHSLALSLLSFLFLAGALIFLLFGTEVFRETFFPLFFLATIIPLPIAIYDQIAHWMRSINTFCSVALTKALGVPLHREEFNIFLPELRLFVDDSCSGIRYLLSFFTFSLVYAYLFKRNNYVRLLVVLSSIPLAIVAGIIRLSAIFLAAYYISPYWAESRPHILLSWFVFTVFLFGAIGVDQYVDKALHERKTGDKVQDK
jgi:exosortase